MTEHDEQVILMNWAAQNSRPELHNLFAIPNQGRRSYRVAQYFKSEGLRAGVPDLFLAWPTTMYSGLFLELKSPMGKATEQQNVWLSRLSQAGYYTQVCKSAEEAIQTIKAYLGKELET